MCHLYMFQRQGSLSFRVETGEVSQPNWILGARVSCSFLSRAQISHFQDKEGRARALSPIQTSHHGVSPVRSKLSQEKEKDYLLAGGPEIRASSNSPCPIHPPNEPKSVLWQRRRFRTNFRHFFLLFPSRSPLGIPGNLKPFLLLLLSPFLLLHPCQPFPATHKKREREREAELSSWRRNGKRERNRGREAWREERGGAVRKRRRKWWRKRRERERERERERRERRKKFNPFLLLPFPPLDQSGEEGRKQTGKRGGPTPPLPPFSVCPLSKPSFHNDQRDSSSTTLLAPEVLCRPSRYSAERAFCKPWIRGTEGGGDFSLSPPPSE